MKGFTGAVLLFFLDFYVVQYVVHKKSGGLAVSDEEGLPYKTLLFNHLAEREGFEPSVRIATYTRFPGVRLKPLIHLSGEANSNRSTPFPKSAAGCYWMPSFSC